MANKFTAGIALIKRWEQCRLRAFIPIPGDPPTVGWGSTGTGITLQTVWTQEQADADLYNRCALLASRINGAVKIPMTDNQFGAVLSLCWNIGIGAFLNSTLLKKLNIGDMNGAADQFPVWNKAHGQVVKGLTNRREDERYVFLT